MADGKVEFIGQPVIAVAADSHLETARKAAMAAIIEYEDLEPVLDVVEALHRSTSCSTATPTSAATRPPPWPARRVGCRVRCIGGQEHFYLETQVSSVMPTEDGGMIVYTSTQNPTGCRSWWPKCSAYR